MNSGLDLERARLVGAIRRLTEQVRAINTGTASLGGRTVCQVVAEDFRRASTMVELVGQSLDLTVRKVGALHEFEAALARLNAAIDGHQPDLGDGG